jgi:glyoxylase-like metal-dependent hydrolase (beta-lactamase superfamily II)/rhodanese-related sulfurtransferase
MKIEQFYDDNLAHASYAILSENEIALIDPARDPHQYYEYAEKHNASIKAVIETHPHADFVSSHVEISKKTGADIYVSSLLNPLYDFTPFDEGDTITVGKITLKALHTPGHSPDSISIVITDEDGKDYALASGDTLFIGDVGRPDLRENVGAVQEKREDLARMMYDSIHEKLLKLSDDILVYPAHGAGSLCGKALSQERVSTIGKQKKENYALQPMSEEKFVETLLQDQPMIPKYFGHSVELNRKGAPDFEASVSAVPVLDKNEKLDENVLVIDSRSKEDYAKGHLKDSINIPDSKSFETWLGSIVSPDENFYLISENEEKGKNLVKRIAKIGYEGLIIGVLENPDYATHTSTELNHEKFKNNKEDFNILDVRNPGERKDRVIFEDSDFIPLHQLRERLDEIKSDKPVVIHCAGGMRSAIAQSIVQNKVDVKVHDLGEKVREY